jgi:hypothetical protein
MSIPISSELFLVGIFTASQEPITQEFLWETRNVFYKLNDEFLIDICISAINITCLSRSDLFSRDLLGRLFPLESVKSQFEDGSLLTNYLKIYNVPTRKLIKKAFGI